MSAIPIPRVLGIPARAVGALVALVALVAALLTVLPTQARAAINPKITVSGLSLVVSNANGVEEPDNTSVKVDDILKLKFAWDARNAKAKSGDSFQIQLPEQLRNRERLSEPMKVLHQGVKHTVGECAMDERTITCTFNSTLDTIVGQGFTGLRGNGSALVVASQASDSANVTIDANGKQTEVPVPGGKIAENVGHAHKPQWMSKWAVDITSTSKVVDWEVTFGPDQVKEALEKNGQSLTVDGRTRSTITFSDEISHPVLATPGSLAQVLATVIENSLRYGAGTTSVSVRSANGGHAVFIDIADEGEGVAEDIAPHVFERHVSGYGSTGVGLALAKDLVEADGGRIELSQRSPAIFSILLNAVPKSLDPNNVLPQGALVSVGRRRRF